MSPLAAAIAVSEAGPAHAEVIAALHRQAFADAAGGAWDTAAVAALLAMPGAFALIATAGEAPAGLLIARVAADECEIVTIGVAKGRRRRGLGRALLTAGLAAAEARGAARMLLEVGEDNAAALALYRGLGFGAAGRRLGYYGTGASGRPVDAVILVRALGGK